MSRTERKRRKRFIYRAVTFGTILVTTVSLVCLAAIWTGIKIAGAPEVTVPQTTVYLADDLQPFGESHGAQKRYWVSLDQISPYLIDATIAVEDRQFFSHHGFDLKRIAGAVIKDVAARAKVQGASTITQQYARNLFLGSEKTWTRKAKEAFYTLRLEEHYSKNEILEGYLNTIYYGHGMYGIEAASHYYFHKNASDLTLTEASILAGIPKGPSLYSPIHSPENAKRRQEIVLRSMEATGAITKAQGEKAQQAFQHTALYGSLDTEDLAKAPYFLDAVNQELRTVLQGREDLIRAGGLTVYTTLNIAQQAKAEDIVTAHIPDKSELQVALVAMNPKSGGVKALIGGTNYEKSAYNRATQSLRQPGSTIKPLLYYTALEKGFTPSTTMRSEETTFSYDEGKSSYTPHNFRNHYANEAITMAQAIAVSDNIYAVKTHLFLGQEELVKAGKRFGLTSKMTKVPSLALGTSGVKPIEMANAYNYFANGGKKVKPFFITKVLDRDGSTLYERKPKKKKALDQANAYVMTQMLTGVFDEKLNGYASVTGSSIIPKLSRPYAGKSGSTEYDSWMIGFTPQLTTGIWAGYDQSRKLETKYDKTTAKQIWAEFMESSHEDKPVTDFKQPKGVIGVEIDPVTGMLADENCPVKRMTYFKKGSEPKEICPLHGHTEDSTDQNSGTDKEKQPWYKRFWPFKHGV
ncbi:transglycosylase domain-containing protein [Gracilibacillus sp. Marseille-QA3620]